MEISSSVVDRNVTGIIYVSLKVWYRYRETCGTTRERRGFYAIILKNSGNYSLHAIRNQNRHISSIFQRLNLFICLARGWAATFSKRGGKRAFHSVLLSSENTELRLHNAPSFLLYYIRCTLQYKMYSVTGQVPFQCIECNRPPI